MVTKITAPAGLKVEDGPFSPNYEPNTEQCYFLNGVCYTESPTWKAYFLRKAGYTVETVADAAVPANFTNAVITWSQFPNTEPEPLGGRSQDAAAPAPATRTRVYTGTVYPGSPVAPLYVPASANPNA